MMLKITESYKTAVISTAHVTQHDSECLPNICFDPLTAGVGSVQEHLI
ncbi:hypothetical protein B5A14_005350 [Salmonella enterica subsp. enterica serovar Luciana]|nr:hypothetical protein [Salmonella enterica subsp. enterica serovar Luciana]EDX3294473.1 hypothetical protein [Salmonella enterica subsp. enterica serovar Luciana]